MKRAAALLVVLTPFCVFANHLRGGQVTVDQHPGSLSCTVTVTLYTNVDSPIRAGNGQLAFGDGSPAMLIPQLESPILISPSVGYATFSIEHTYPGQGLYQVTYIERNLDAGILNIFNSVETPLVLQTRISLDPMAGTNRTPVFPVEPIFAFNLGDTCRISLAPIDTSGLHYRYQYQLFIPQSQDAQAYRLPDGISIDANTGVLNWADTLFEFQPAIGEFYFLVSVSYYNELGNQMGSIVRAFQLELKRGQSHISVPVPPDHGRIYVAPGNVKKIKVLLKDNLATKGLQWRLYNDSEINSDIKLEQHDSTSLTNNFKVATLTINPGAAEERDYPYTIVLRGLSYFDSEQNASDVSFQLFTRDIQLDPIAGIPEVFPNNIRVYPNPFSSYFHIDGCLSPTIHFSIMDVMGRPVLSQDADPRVAIDGTSLSPGVYILRSFDGPTIVERKIIKQ